jgi:hypothetical protein
MKQTQRKLLLFNELTKHCVQRVIQIFLYKYYLAVIINRSLRRSEI